MRMHGQFKCNDSNKHPLCSILFKRLRHPYRLSEMAWTEKENTHFKAIIDTTRGSKCKSSIQCSLDVVIKVYKRQKISGGNHGV